MDIGISILPSNSTNEPSILPSSFVLDEKENGKRSDNKSAPSITFPFLMNEGLSTLSTDMQVTDTINGHRVSNGKSMVILFPSDNKDEVNKPVVVSEKSVESLRSAETKTDTPDCTVPLSPYLDKSEVRGTIIPKISSFILQDTDPLPLANHPKDFTSTSFKGYGARRNRGKRKGPSVKLQRYRATSHVSFNDLDELPNVSETIPVPKESEYSTSHYLLSVFLLLFLWSSWTIATIVLGVDTVYFHSYIDNTVCNQYWLLPWIRAYTVTATISLCSIIACFIMGFVIYPCYQNCLRSYFRSGSNSMKTSTSDRTGGNYFLPIWLWIPIATFAALFLQLILGTVLLSLTMEQNDNTCRSSLLYQDTIYIIATSWPLSVLTFVVLVLYLYSFGPSSLKHDHEDNTVPLRSQSSLRNQRTDYKPRSYSTDDAYERRRKIKNNPHLRSPLPSDWPSFLSPPRNPISSSSTVSLSTPSKAPHSARPRANSNRTHLSKWGNRVVTGVDEKGQRIHTPPPMFSPFAKGTDPDLTRTASTNSVSFTSSKLFQTLSFLLHRHSSKVTVKSVSSGPGPTMKNDNPHNSISELSDITGIDYESVEEASQASSVHKSVKMHRKSISVVTGETYISVPDQDDNDGHSSTTIYISNSSRSNDLSRKTDSTNTTDDQHTQSTSSNSDHEVTRSLTGGSHRTRSLSTASSVHSAVAAIATVTIAGIHHAIRVSSSTVHAAFTSPTSVPTQTSHVGPTGKSKRNSVTETTNVSAYSRLMGNRNLKTETSVSSGLTSGGDFIGLQLMMDDDTDNNYHGGDREGINGTMVIHRTSNNSNNNNAIIGYQHTMDDNYTITTPSGDTYPTIHDDQSDIHITVENEDNNYSSSFPSQTRSRTVSRTSDL